MIPAGMISPTIFSPGGKVIFYNHRRGFPFQIDSKG